MGARPPVRQRSSPDALGIRLLMKRHKEPAPARPLTPLRRPASQPGAALGALCPGSPAARAPSDTRATKPGARWGQPGGPRAPRPGPADTRAPPTRAAPRRPGARPPTPLSPGARPAVAPTRAPSHPWPSLTLCASAAAFRPPAGRPALLAAPRPRRQARAARSSRRRPGSPPSAPGALLTAARPAPSWKLVTSVPPAHP